MNWPQSNEADAPIIYDANILFPLHVSHIPEILESQKLSEFVKRLRGLK
jgi:hypothetical protein